MPFLGATHPNAGKQRWAYANGLVERRLFLADGDQQFRDERHVAEAVRGTTPVPARHTPHATRHTPRVTLSNAILVNGMARTATLSKQK